jgi:hypothetical protein
MLFADDAVLMDESRTGLSRSWSCGYELWRQEVLDVVDLKRSTCSVILVLPHKRMEMLDSMVR